MLFVLDLNYITLLASFHIMNELFITCIYWITSIWSLKCNFPLINNQIHVPYSTKVYFDILSQIFGEIKLLLHTKCNQSIFVNTPLFFKRNQGNVKHKN